VTLCLHFCVLLVIAYLFACHLVYVGCYFALHTDFQEITIHFKQLVTATALPLHISVPGTGRDWKSTSLCTRKHKPLGQFYNSNCNDRKRHSQRNLPL